MLSDNVQPWRPAAGRPAAGTRPCAPADGRGARTRPPSRAAARGNEGGLCRGGATRPQHGVTEGERRAKHPPLPCPAGASGQRCTSLRAGAPAAWDGFSCQPATLGYEYSVKQARDGLPPSCPPSQGYFSGLPGLCKPPPGTSLSPLLSHGPPCLASDFITTPGPAKRDLVRDSPGEGTAQVKPAGFTLRGTSARLSG